ncbi:MAG: ABC transporter permease [Deltaproteobacteria bacterium]|nr:ABC transporter permease [Deltaproteobacteria bacterium]
MFSRALRGIRQSLGTQLLSVATVALALFCMAGALLLVENAGAMVRRWGAPVRMTVYLADGASGSGVEALRSALAALPEVESARYVSPADARASLGHGDDALADAPVDLFPATIELRLVPAAMTPSRLGAVADRVRRLPTVTGVETYRGFTDRLRAMLTGGRAAAGFLALGVLVCVFAVVSNTVRMSLQSRGREIEVLRLVGASPGYVRAPFLLEGAFLGVFGALAAVTLLGVFFFGFRYQFDQTLGLALGVRPVFLSGWVVLGLLTGGGALGALGSAAALQRGLNGAPT